MAQKKAEKKLLVVVSLDVEEEGLFTGRYPRVSPQVTNVKELRRLAPLSTELQLPLTLFCAYAVFADPEAAGHIAWMRDHCGAEIGAHLHHWNTPPNVGAGEEAPARTASLPEDLLKARLTSLLETGERFQGTPLTSFRMGRWDLSARILPLLAEAGIKVDSSVCPLRAVPGGPDHFFAPADPYWVGWENEKRILEAPITQIPLFRRLPALWKTISGIARVKLDLFHFFGALSVNPFWHGEKIMRLATSLHVARGGRVLNLFWHSSEMLPGASPHIPDRDTRNNRLAKIFSYLFWLRKNYDVVGLTASQLAANPWKTDFPQLELQAGRDW